jgi:hypothetical protein
VIYLQDWCSSDGEACTSQGEHPDMLHQDYQGITDFNICDPFLFCQLFASLMGI